MSIAKKLKDYLEENHVSYTHSSHRLAYTAREVAAAQHISGWELAKTVVLKADDHFVMIVLPAVTKIDWKELYDQLPFRQLELATEKELASLFPDSELGAMAPFGTLYNLPVYVDIGLAVKNEIVFNAGSHVETIRMNYKDFERLVQPKLIHAAPVTAQA